MKKAPVVKIVMLLAIIAPLIYSELVISMSSEHGLIVIQGTIFALIIYVIAIVVYAMRVEFKLTLSHSRSQANLNLLTDNLNSVKEKLSLVDSEIRKQVSLWLHGTVQSKLMKISREIRDLNSSEAESLASQLDDLTENVVRNYSHHLFPPSLNISLEMGLLELVGDTVDLDLDVSLSSQSELGMTSIDKNNNSDRREKPKRLLLAPALAYAIYRVVEEGLSNAAKKKTVTQIKVSVKVKDDQIQVVVEDNGEKIQTSVEPGLGCTLFDIYASQFGGSWALENSFGGVALRMTFLFSPQTVEQVIFGAGSKKG